MTNDKRQMTTQAGSVLIAAIGALTVMLILLTGMLSTVAHELQREREAEMLFRGQQIVQAIGRYQALAGRVAGRGRQPQAVTALGVWPQSLEQLVEGVTLPPNRRVRLLRPSALHDPMTSTGDWKPVTFGEPALEHFLEAYFDHINRTMPPIVRIKYLGQTIDFEGDDERSGQDANRRLPSSAVRALSRVLGQQPGRLSQDNESDDGQASFIFGVVSRSEGKPIRDYFGLERYNQWVFAYIPELPMLTGDESIEMLTREILFPSDPLSWRTGRFAGRGQVVVPSRGQRETLDRLRPGTGTPQGGVRPGRSPRPQPNRGGYR